MKQQKRSPKKYYIIIAAIVISILALFAILEATGVTRLTPIRNTLLNKSESEAKTTSTAPTAQDNFSEGNQRKTETTPKQEGGVKDNAGVIPTVPPESQWTSSDTGAITTYSPAANTQLSSGYMISGKTSLKNISFRLIDNTSGVIARGPIQVVDGKFSGTLNFSTKGTEGRLDIFSSDADGVESHNISIPVRF